MFEGPVEATPTTTCEFLRTTDLLPFPWDFKLKEILLMHLGTQNTKRLRLTASVRIPAYPTVSQQSQKETCKIVTARRSSLTSAGSLAEAFATRDLRIASSSICLPKGKILEAYLASSWASIRHSVAVAFNCKHFCQPRNIDWLKQRPYKKLDNTTIDISRNMHCHCELSDQICMHPRRRHCLVV